MHDPFYQIPATFQVAERCDPIHNGLYCLRRLAETSARLDASIGATAARDMYRSSFRYCRVHRFPHPTSVTIAKRPSCGRETLRILPVIWGGDQLRHIGTTGKSVVVLRRRVKGMLSSRSGHLLRPAVVRLLRGSPVNCPDVERPGGRSFRLQRRDRRPFLINA